MADSTPKKASIPSWQRASATPAASTVGSPGAEDSTKQESAPAAVSSSPEKSSKDNRSEPEVSLLDQASKFLEDPTIQGAPTDRKIAFLESKGVSNENIQKLLGISRNKEASSDLSTSAASAWHDPVPEKQPPRQTQSVQPFPRDVPPIVTYPEFLTQPAKPPPLIAASHLLTTAYVTGSIAAALYGLSKFILAPMSANMTEARHDFASHAQTHLAEVNDQLSGLVSAVPSTTTKTTVPVSTDDAASEADTTSSDPTELFHRDYGTQTSPDLSRRPSSSSLPSPKTDTVAPDSVLTGHEKRLKIIHSHISEFLDDSTNNGTTAEEVETQLKDLEQYLDTLTYDRSGAWSGGVYGGGSNLLKEKDAISAVRDEIRGVKGVLLSAKNFPGSLRSTGGAVGVGA
ncbi:peroxin Pex14/17-penicillium chrysogenum [Cryomyces antarcticus]|nr:hypothetical protein LTR04_006544 [Oleoguttula sp. CCFEE 6159]